MGSACENRGKRRAASVFENERCLIASVGGMPARCQEDGGGLKELQTVETSLSPWRCKEYYLTINDGLDKKNKTTKSD